MRKVQIVLAALVLFSVVAFTVTDNTKLLKINHKGKVIEVAEQAVPAHLAHGDFLIGNNGSGSTSQILN